MAEWNMQLEQARERLRRSKICYEKFRDEDSKQWIVEDEQKIAAIVNNMKKAIAFMDKYNIK